MSAVARIISNDVEFLDRCGRIYAPIRSMPELVAAFRACRDERRLTHETIDDLAGWPSGYCSKLLAPEPIKNLGWMSLGLALGTFGKMLLMVDDPEQIQRIKDRWTPREKPIRQPALQKTEG